MRRDEVDQGGEAAGIGREERVSLDARCRSPRQVLTQPLDEEEKMYTMNDICKCSGWHLKYILVQRNPPRPSRITNPVIPLPRP